MGIFHNKLSGNPAMQSISFSKKLMWLQMQYPQRVVSPYPSSQQGFKSVCSLIGCARGVEVCLQTRAKQVGGSYHSTHSPLLYNLIGGGAQIGRPVGPPERDGP